MEMQRYKDAGCILAEDLGRDNSTFEYTGTTVVNSPFGLARRFDNHQTVNLNKNIILDKNSATINIKFKKNRASLSHDVLICGNEYWYSYVGFNGNTFCIEGVSNNDFWSNIDIGDDMLWHTLSTVANGGVVKTYYDSILIDTKNPATNILFNTVGGKASKGFSCGCDIKEIILDNRIWSEQEILNYHKCQVYDYDNSIVSRWNLDSTDTIKDLGYRGLDNIGTVVGNPVLKNSIFGNSLVFDGANDYVDCGNIDKLNGIKNFSISCWIKVASSALAKDGDIFSKGTHNEGVSLLMWRDDAVGAGHKIGNVKTISVIATDINSSSLWISGNSNAIADDSWYFITVTMQYNSITGFNLYIDGKLHDTISSINFNGIKSSSYSAIIGSPTDGVLKNMFNGAIDKVMVFDKALTAIQVKDLYNRTKRGEL